MSSDLIGRRRAVEQRLDRARALELSLKEKTEILAETTGMSIEQLDFDGSFRASLAALAAVASRRTHFDVIVTLPDAPFGVRIQHVNDAVSAEVVIPRDGPYESMPSKPAAIEPDSVAAIASESASVPDGWGAPRSEPTAAAAGDHVASDLAALLWEGVDDMPS
jgi:hypothetical protein